MLQSLPFRSARSILVLLIACAAPQLACADAVSAVHDAYHKLIQSRFRSDTTVTDGAGKITHSKSDFDTLQRIHATTDHGEFILVPEGLWMKTGTSWNQPPVNMSGMIQRFQPMNEEVLRSMKNVTDDGMASWQGQPAHAYSYDSEITIMTVHASAHSKLYVNAAGQVIGSEGDSTAMGRKSHTVQTITYDDSIRVVAPK